MKIGVLGDTHIPLAASELPREIYEEFRKVDMILHCGDLIELDVLDRLREIAPIKAVCGNMDTPEVCEKLPIKDVISAGGIKIGLIHGWGPPSGLVKLVGSEFRNVDVIIFGHSHEPLSLTKDGVLFFNPGTPTDRIYARHNTYGILDVKEGKTYPNIIYLKR